MPSGSESRNRQKYANLTRDRYSGSYNINSRTSVSTKVEDDDRNRRAVKEENKDIDWDVKQDFVSKPAMEGPNFEVSGILAEDQNQINGVALTFSIPSDSVVPDSSDADWRLFEFHGDDNSRIIKLVKYSSFLLGSDSRLQGADASMDFIHFPDDTVSKQHAVIQFRKREKGVVPYLLDLASTNGTFLNGELCASGRYIELKHQDVLKFGSSTRLEYVVMDAK